VRLATFTPVSAAVRPQAPDASAGTPPARAAVSLRNVSKGFKLPHERYHTLKERALHPFRTTSFDILQALDDVSVDVTEGEFFGIVGRNGSGKSTMLKCLAGIYDIDSGGLEINGRLSPFLELGVGFNFDLTGRDNVIINAIMLGLTRKQALDRFDAIVEFAELEEFIDLKLKNYSSGMQVRLAFAVAIQVDAEIMLIDEVLAVGDARFQQKCFDELARVKQAGRTILFVTHDMGSVQRFCDRAMLLERGQVVDIGDPESVARQYNQLNFRRVRKEARETGGPEILRATPVAEVEDAVFESDDGEVLVTTQQGEPCVIRMNVRFHGDAHNPIFGVSLRSELGHAVFAASTISNEMQSGDYRAGETATIRIRFENWLAPGRYRLMATVAREGLGSDLLDLHADSSLIVLSTRPGGGAVDLPHTLEISRT
jgi:ABC-type polysaccharide/polyol phosphate transport system ATPase subunit